MIALALHCTQLDHITLRGLGNLTDAAVEALAENCKRLRTIIIMPCVNLTAWAVLALAEHCHQLNYVRLLHCTETVLAAAPVLSKRFPHAKSIVEAVHFRILDQLIQWLHM